MTDTTPQSKSIPVASCGFFGWGKTNYDVEKCSAVEFKNGACDASSVCGQGTIMGPEGLCIIPPETTTTTTTSETTGTTAAPSTTCGSGEYMDAQNACVAIPSYSDYSDLETECQARITAMGFDSYIVRTDPSHGTVCEIKEMTGKTCVPPEGSTFNTDFEDRIICAVTAFTPESDLTKHLPTGQTRRM